MGSVPGDRSQHSCSCVRTTEQQARHQDTGCKPQSRASSSRRESKSASEARNKIDGPPSEHSDIDFHTKHRESSRTIRMLYSLVRRVLAL